MTSAALTRRIGALETSGGGHLSFVSILRVVVPNSGAGPWTATLRGERIDSEPGESEKDFSRRLHGLALAGRKRGDYGTTVVMTEADYNL